MVINGKNTIFFIGAPPYSVSEEYFSMLTDYFHNEVAKEKKEKITKGVSNE